MSTTEVVMPRTRCRNTQIKKYDLRPGDEIVGAVRASFGGEQRWDKCKPLVRLARSTA
jgi:transcription termination factor Rho